MISSPYVIDLHNQLARPMENTDVRTTGANNAHRVLGELGLVLLIPLVGAGIVGLILKTAGIY